MGRRDKRPARSVLDQHHDESARASRGRRSTREAPPGAHRLFQSQGITVSAWIRQQRLERCRRGLTTRPAERLKTATWVTYFSNTKWRHSAAGGKPSAAFERITQQARARTDQESRAA